jgi:hypothetical protein
VRIELLDPRKEQEYSAAIRAALAETEKKEITTKYLRTRLYEKWETEASQSGVDYVKGYWWRSNNEKAFEIDNEFFTRTPMFKVTLLNTRGGEIPMGTAMVGEVFDTDPKETFPGGKLKGQQGFGNRGIDPWVNIESGRMKPLNLRLLCSQTPPTSALQSATQAIGVGSRSKITGGYINLSLEIVVPATRNMNPELLNAITRSRSSLTMGTKTWGDTLRFHQMYFERWSPTESLYKQHLEDLQQNIHLKRAEKTREMRNWLRSTAESVFGGYGDEGEHQMSCAD